MANSLPVVNLQLWLAARAKPLALLAQVVIVAVIRLLLGSSVAGQNTALALEYTTSP
jgi:hypothetical protein